MAYADQTDEPGYPPATYHVAEIRGGRICPPEAAPF